MTTATMTLARPTVRTDDYADSLIAAVATNPGRKAAWYARFLGYDQAEAGRTLRWLAENDHVRATRHNGRAVYLPA